MKYKIKDLNYINQDNFTAELLGNFDFDNSTIFKLLKGIQNRVNLTTETVLSYVDKFKWAEEDLRGYLMLEDAQHNYYVIREDNLIEVEELADKYESIGIKGIIKSGDKMIVIPSDAYRAAGYKKVVITRSSEDADDNVKALMTCLLKRNGFNIDNIYTIAETIVDDVEAKDIVEVINEPVKKEKKAKKTKTKSKTK